jgi:hypothetical protein
LVEIIETASIEEPIKKFASSFDMEKIMIELSKTARINFDAKVEICYRLVDVEDNRYTHRYNLFTMRRVQGKSQIMQAFDKYEIAKAHSDAVERNRVIQYVQSMRAGFFNDANQHHKKIEAMNAFKKEVLDGLVDKFNNAVCNGKFNFTECGVTLYSNSIDYSPLGINIYVQYLNTGDSSLITEAEEILNAARDSSDPVKIRISIQKLDNVSFGVIASFYSMRT